MGVNYKTLSDFEVATAEEAQSYFMDQAIIKVDADVDLASLPNEVKTAYVLNTGVLMARDNTNAWKRAGGAAVVNETAPSNPTVGDLWVKPSEVLPVPVRGTVIATTKSITATTYTAVTLDTTRSITLPKAAMCHYSFHARMDGASATDVQSYLSWSGATTGGSYDQIGTFGHTLLSSGTLVVGHMSGTVVLAAGTTTFGVMAKRANTSNATSIGVAAIEVTPIQWADAYDAGVT